MNVTHYNVSKAGISHLARCMALELADKGIRVNSLCPGLTETDINRKDIAKEEFRNARLATIPLKRIAQPEDLVASAIYLASDDSRMVTGIQLFVDGGNSMR